MKYAIAPSTQSGLSLIELMVAITLGLMITTTLGYILMGSRSTYRTQDASARVQDTGRFAMEVIGRQLRWSGRVDISPLASDSRTNTIGLPANWTPIAGINGTAAIGKKVPAVNASGEVKRSDDTKQQTDTVTVQYQATAAGGTVTNTISLDGNGLELESSENGAAPQPFAEGVEDLQIRYAEAAAPSLFKTVLADYANVVAVQVCIMVQSPGNGIVTTPQIIRDCSGNNYTPTDTRLRRTFTSVFVLRNRINAIP